MTGATGALTPEGTDEPFVPAERREISDASASGAGTVSMRRQSDEAQAAAGDPPGEEEPRGGAGGHTELATRGGGYGSGRGLAADDPAYRVETDSRHTERGSQPAEGDERSDREERF